MSSDKGLVVPVLRDADTMGLATVEDTIRDYGTRARAGKLTLGRNARRHIYHHERGCLWFFAINADTKSAADRNFGYAQDTGASDGG